MSTNPRFVTRPPKADKRREQKLRHFPGAPIAGKPLSVDEQFRAVFGSKK